MRRALTLWKSAAAGLLLLLFWSGRTEAFLTTSVSLTAALRVSSYIPETSRASTGTSFGAVPSFLVDSTVLVSNVVEAVEPGQAYLTVLGSSSVMFTIVALLYSWEKTVSFLRSTVPKSLLPVLESILGEIGGLGFIGLILSTLLPPSKEFLEEASVFFFREGDVLIETFEYLHAAVFQVGVGFFLSAGAMVAVGLQKLGEMNEIEQLQVDVTTGACTATADKLATMVPIEQNVQQLPQVNLWDEINMGKEERAGKSLLLRDRLMTLYDLPDTFRIEKYVSLAFSENLLEIVELSPLTWIYLIPALALANAIDLSHEVVNAASPNAAASAGYFFSTPTALLPSIFTVALSLVWGLWNCWKMTQVKYMLLPRLVGTNESGGYEILPAAVDDGLLRRSFSSSPWWVSMIEGLWAEPPENDFDELFGSAGAAGVELYRDSIQKQTWLCITHIVFFGTQIVPRDIDALLSGASVGDPTHLLPELITYSSFVLISIAQLILITPRSFWNFCLVSCAQEGVASSEMLDKCLQSDSTQT